MGEEISPELLQAIDSKIETSITNLTASITQSVTDAIQSSLTDIVNVAIQKAKEEFNEISSTALPMR